MRLSPRSSCSGSVKRLPYPTAFTVQFRSPHSCFPSVQDGLISWQAAEDSGRKVTNLCLDLRRVLKSPGRGVALAWLLDCAYR